MFARNHGAARRDRAGRRGAAKKGPKDRRQDAAWDTDSLSLLMASRSGQEDPLGRQADRVADQVVDVPESAGEKEEEKSQAKPLLQLEAEKEEEKLHAKSGSSPAAHMLQQNREHT